MKGQRIIYSDTELAWIEARAKLPRRTLYADFTKVFQRKDVRFENLTSLCKRRGWHTGRTGRFPKGSTPPNKGKKMLFNAKSAATQFKKGHRGGRAAERYKPIGAERISQEGYVERKIHDKMPLQSRWRAVHILRWEKENGPVPDGSCLKCVDGNRQNTEPSNWLAIPRALLPRINGRWSLGYDEAEPELKPYVLAVARLKQAVSEADKTQQGSKS